MRQLPEKMVLDDKKSPSGPYIYNGTMQIRIRLCIDKDTIMKIWGFDILPDDCFVEPIQQV
jgi:hypothetical protein